MIKRIAFTLIMWCFAGQAAFAQSSDPQVEAGSAQISDDGGNLTVTTSDRTIIAWGAFGVDSGKYVNFVQPSSAAAVLNRVTGSEASYINGLLQSNGRVYLINPNGIVIGSSGVIQAGSFVASTLDVSNDDFLAGGTLNFSGSSGAGVANLGKIETIGGDVFLIAKTVSNSGDISAAGGKIGLAAGTNVMLTYDGEIFIQSDSCDETAAEGIANSGTLEALNVELKANGNAYSLAINNSGVISATGYDIADGRVILCADGGKVVNTGAITAKTIDGSNQTAGGTILVLGQDVVLDGAAVLDASGDLGGGTINVGGNYQGEGDLLNAETTYVGDAVQILADSYLRGDGGTVIVWADDATYFGGSISAQAEGAGGDGGLVETSGGVLTVAESGSVDASSAYGAAGSWLLDPYNINIGTGAESNGSWSGTTWQATASTSNINVSNIITALNAGTSVTVSTGTSGGDADGNITLTAAIAKTSGGDASLTLLAANNLYLGSGGDISSSSGKLNVTLTADCDSSGSGNLALDNNINTNNGDLILSGYKVTLGVSGRSRTVVGTGTISANATGGGVDATWAQVCANNLVLTGTGDFIFSCSSGGGSPTSPINNSIGNVAANINGTLVVHSIIPLTVGSVGGVSGITTSGGNVVLATDDADMTLSQSINAGSGTVLLHNTAHEVAPILCTFLILSSSSGSSSCIQTGGSITCGDLLLFGDGAFSLNSSSNNVSRLGLESTGMNYSFTNCNSFSVGIAGWYGLNEIFNNVAVQLNAAGIPYSGMSMTSTFSLGAGIIIYYDSGATAEQRAEGERIRLAYGSYYWLRVLYAALQNSSGASISSTDLDEILNSNITARYETVDNFAMPELGGLSAGKSVDDLHFGLRFADLRTGDQNTPGVSLDLAFEDFNRLFE